MVEVFELDTNINEWSDVLEQSKDLLLNGIVFTEHRSNSAAFCDVVLSWVFNYFKITLTE